MVSQRDREEEFLRSLMAIQNALKGYVLAHVRDPAVTEDIMQDAAVVLWKKFDQYERERSFMGWAMGVARNLILRSRRDIARNPIVFDNDLAERFAARYETLEPELDVRRHALQRCLEQISGPARQMITLRYEDRLSMKQVAARLGRTVNAMNVAVSRVRASLAKCIEGLAGDLADTDIAQECK